MALSFIDLLCIGNGLTRWASILLGQQSAAEQLPARPFLVGNGEASRMAGHASLWCREAELAAGAMVDMAGKRLQDLRDVTTYWGNCLDLHESSATHP